MTDQQIAFWDVNRDAEQLQHLDRDEAVEYWLDEVDAAEWPALLTVYGYARAVVDRAKLCPLESLLEYLDDWYGSDDASEPTPGMRAAEELFVDAVLADYQVQHCRVVAEEQIDVAQFVRDHCPEWAKPGNDNRGTVRKFLAEHPLGAEASKGKVTP